MNFLQEILDNIQLFVEKHDVFFDSDRDIVPKQNHDQNISIPKNIFQEHNFPDLPMNDMAKIQGENNYLVVDFLIDNILNHDWNFYMLILDYMDNNQLT